MSEITRLPRSITHKNDYINITFCFFEGVLLKSNSFVLVHVYVKVHYRLHCSNIQLFCFSGIGKEEFSVILCCATSFKLAS